MERRFWDLKVQTAQIRHKLLAPTSIPISFFGWGKYFSSHPKNIVFWIPGKYMGHKLDTNYWHQDRPLRRFWEWNKYFCSPQNCFPNREERVFINFLLKTSPFPKKWSNTRPKLFFAVFSENIFFWKNCLTWKYLASKGASTSVYECRMRHAEMRKMMMWMCSGGAVNSINLCGERFLNSQMLSVWSRYFKKNMFAMLGIRLTRRTSNKPLFYICSGSPQSRMPRSWSRTDVDIP